MLECKKWSTCCCLLHARQVCYYMISSNNQFNIRFWYLMTNAYTNNICQQDSFHLQFINWTKQKILTSQRIVKSSSTLSVAVMIAHLLRRFSITPFLYSSGNVISTVITGSRICHCPLSYTGNGHRHKNYNYENG